MKTYLTLNLFKILAYKTSKRIHKNYDLFKFSKFKNGAQIIIIKKNHLKYSFCFKLNKKSSFKLNKKLNFHSIENTYFFQYTPVILNKIRTLIPIPHQIIKIQTESDKNYLSMY